MRHAPPIRHTVPPIRQTVVEVAGCGRPRNGGRGVLYGVTVEELYREIRALRIYEGTSEIQKLVIARGVLDEHAGD